MHLLHGRGFTGYMTEFWNSELCHQSRLADSISKSRYCFPKFGDTSPNTVNASISSWTSGRRWNPEVSWPFVAFVILLLLTSPHRFIPPPSTSSHLCDHLPYNDRNDQGQELFTRAANKRRAILTDMTTLSSMYERLTQRGEMRLSAL